MASELFKKINDLEGGESIRIHFSENDDTVKYAGVEFSNPWVTTVDEVNEETKDPRQGDEVHHMEFHQIARLEAPDGVIFPDRIIIKTAHKMEQDNILNLTFMQLIEDTPGHFRHISLEFDGIEILD